MIAPVVLVEFAGAGSSGAHVRILTRSGGSATHPGPNTPAQNPLLMHLFGVALAVAEAKLDREVDDVMLALVLDEPL